MLYTNIKEEGINKKKTTNQGVHLTDLGTMMSKVLIDKADVKKLVKLGFTQQPLEADNHCFTKKIVDGVKIELLYNANNDYDGKSRWTGVVIYGFDTFGDRFQNPPEPDMRSCFLAVMSKVNKYAVELQTAVDKLVTDFVFPM